MKRRRLASVYHKNREAWWLFSAKLVIRIIFRLDGSPRPSGTGPILESSITGAEAPAYYQGVPPGLYLACLNALTKHARSACLRIF